MGYIFGLKDTQWGYHGAAVYAEIVRQLLPVEGNIEIVPAAAHGLIGEIGQQPSPDGLGRGVEDAAGQAEIFLRGDDQQIADEGHMPPRAGYADRVFTTEVVSFPGCAHIGEDKDFSPVIEKALALGGYAQDTDFTGINGGRTVTTGFGHDAVLGVADKVIDAVKSGVLKHIFLVGGCDGARPGRNYYTEFVMQTPPDSLVLTLACGKYRFNDLDLGTVGGLPRLMDMAAKSATSSAVRPSVDTIL